LESVEPFEGEDAVVHCLDVGSAGGIGVGAELLDGLLGIHFGVLLVVALKLFDFVLDEVHGGTGGADAVEADAKVTGVV